MRVAYIAHDATRSGAPMMLLRTMRWLASHTDVEQRTVVRMGGPLVADYASFGPTVVAPEWMSMRARIFRGVPSRLQMVTRYRLPGARRAFADADLVYANSAQSAELFDLVPRDVPIVAHLHEMAEALHRLPARTAELLSTRPVHYLVPSDAAAVGATEVLGISADRMTVVHPFVESVTTPADRSEVDALRASLGIGPDTLLVGGAGRIDLCKGFDLLPALCSRLADVVDAHLVWIGSGDDYLRRLVERDVRLMGLEDRFTLLSEVADPTGWFSAFDVFCLPSREDSFPLVAVENAALGNPVVCFDGSGGVNDYIDDAAGASVDFLDVGAMAKAIVELADPEEAARRGAVARDRVRAYTADEVCPAIADVLERHARRSTRR